MTGAPTIRFIRSIAGDRPCDLPRLPEIAIAGRSNAGKSSLINYLANHRRLAHTGKQPGKTRLINYFEVDSRYYLVDLPGYGYARASHTEIEKWGHMMEAFFADTLALDGLIICMDIRRVPSKEDLQMANWAVYYKVPFAIAATKADKVAKSKRSPEALRIAKSLASSCGIKPTVIPLSSSERFGREMLEAWIESMLQGESTV